MLYLQLSLTQNFDVAVTATTISASKAPPELVISVRITTINLDCYWARSLLHLTGQQWQLQAQQFLYSVPLYIC